MKVQLITVNTLPEPGRDVHGAYQRLSLFVSALSTLTKRLEIVHIVPEACIAADSDPDRLDREQSEHWGHPVTVTLIPRRVRRETLRTHYIDGLLHASEQPPISPFAGEAQAMAVGRLLDRQPDIVFVQQLPAMCAVLRSNRRPRRMFFDICDVDHLVRLRACRHPPLRIGNIGYAAHVPAMIAAERRAAALSRKMFVCSAKDQRHLQRLGIRNVAVVPNTVAFPANRPPLTAEPTLLFLGACNYEPNAQAAERLVTRILPLVRRDVPDVRLLIAGKDSETLPSRRTAPAGVDYLGFVADLDGLYARARVVCCPIMMGGGTRIKLVEGAAFARPMVATRIGAEGLDFADEQEILLRDTDAAFAEACVRLLRNSEECHRLGQAARAKARHLYDRDEVLGALTRTLRQPA